MLAGSMGYINRVRSLKIVNVGASVQRTIHIDKLIMDNLLKLKYTAPSSRRARAQRCAAEVAAARWDGRMSMESDEAHGAIKLQAAERF